MTVLEDRDDHPHPHPVIGKIVVVELAVIIVVLLVILHEVEELEHYRN